MRSRLQLLRLCLARSRLRPRQPRPAPPLRRLLVSLQVPEVNDAAGPRKLTFIRPVTAPATFSFGAKAGTTPASTAGAPAPAAAPATSLTFGGAKPAAPAATPAAGGAPGAAATPAVAAPVPSLLRGKTLDEIVNAWSVELDERTRDFVDVAGEVREWDRVLRENGEQVSALPLFAVLRRRVN